MSNNGTTIKHRLLQDIRQQPPEGAQGIGDLAIRHGLNGHDLAKNLDQLRKEGHIVVGWKGDTMVSVKLRHKEPKPALNVADAVRQWLVDQQPNAQRDGWIYTTPTQLREKLNVEGGAVSVAVSDMQASGKLETRKEGARIVALRLLPKEPFAQPADSMAQTKIMQEATADLPPAPEPIRADLRAPVELPATPLLDTYATARQIAKSVSGGNPYIRVEFEAVPIAEEGIRLREALQDLLRSN